MLLYKELYYRHIYSKLQPTLEQRIESWLNYCDIFNLLLNVDSPLALELPNQWLWDMVDEFIYQFQVRRAEGSYSCKGSEGAKGGARNREVGVGGGGAGEMEGGARGRG